MKVKMTKTFNTAFHRKDSLGAPEMLGMQKRYSI